MLEFYSVRFADAKARCLHFSLRTHARTRSGAADRIVAALLVALAGCATTPAALPGSAGVTGRDPLRHQSRRRRSRPRRRCRATSSRRRRRSTCPGSRCRIGRATRTAAPAPPAASARTPTRFSADSNYRTGWHRRPRAVQEEVAALAPSRAPSVAHSSICAACATTCSTGATRAAPKLFLLHGWMDVGASFQFLVDALHGDWHVIAPDLRGFGRSGVATAGLLVRGLRRRSRSAARPLRAR